MGQVSILVWKDFSVLRRHKVMVVLELILPIILSVIACLMVTNFVHLADFTGAFAFDNGVPFWTYCGVQRMAVSPQRAPLPTPAPGGGFSFSSSSGGGGGFPPGPSGFPPPSNVPPAPPPMAPYPPAVQQCWWQSDTTMSLPTHHDVLQQMNTWRKDCVENYAATPGCWTKSTMGLSLFVDGQHGDDSGSGDRDMNTHPNVTGAWLGMRSMMWSAPMMGGILFDTFNLNRNLVVQTHAYGNGNTIGINLRSTFATGAAIMMCFAFFPMAATIAGRLADEKKARMREHLKVMGLSSRAYLTAAYITGAIRVSFVALCMFFTLLGFNVNYLSFTDVLGIWLSLTLLGLSLVSFAQLMPCFFQRSTFASGATSVFLAVSVIASTFISSLSPTVQWVFATLLSPAAAMFALAPQLSGHNVTLAIGVSEAWGLMLWANVFYFALGQYLHSVFPGDYGVPKHPLFPCRWVASLMACGFRKQSNDAEQLGDSMLSTKPTSTGRGSEEEGVVASRIVMENLVKSYTGGGGGAHCCRSLCSCGARHRTGDDDDEEEEEEPAVNKLSLQINSGEIFALLGHNGAGKTTTISVLTGMLPATSYTTATVNGFDITSELDIVRQTIACCPQFDVLIDELSATEHLHLFSRLQSGGPVTTTSKKGDGDGVSGLRHHYRTDEEIQERIDKLLDALQLPTDRQSCSQFSGGTRRRLSVATALVTDAPIVFLDEPSSGLDPLSRRKLWDLLREERNTLGKTIILTTHFMEEADYLGDRIGIMSHGRLYCCDSSAGLKKRYGVGYYLTLAKPMDASSPTTAKSAREEEEDDASSPTSLPFNVEVAADIIHKHCPDAKLHHESIADVTFLIPSSSGSDGAASATSTADGRKVIAAQMLKEIETRFADIGATSYGVTMTSLEDVFVNIASKVERERKEEEEEAKAKHYRTLQQSDKHSGSSNNTSLPCGGRSAEEEDADGDDALSWIPSTSPPLPTSTSQDAAALEGGTTAAATGRQSVAGLFTLAATTTTTTAPRQSGDAGRVRTTSNNDRAGTQQQQPVGALRWWCSQTASVMYKKALYIRRSRRMIFLGVVLPLVVLAVGFAAVFPSWEKLLKIVKPSKNNDMPASSVFSGHLPNLTDLTIPFYADTYTDDIFTLQREMKLLYPKLVATMVETQRKERNETWPSTPRLHFLNILTETDLVLGEFIDTGTLDFFVRKQTPLILQFHHLDFNPTGPDPDHEADSSSSSASGSSGLNIPYANYTYVSPILNGIGRMSPAYFVLVDILVRTTIEHTGEMFHNTSSSSTSGSGGSGSMTNRPVVMPSPLDIVDVDWGPRPDVQTPPPYWEPTAAPPGSEHYFLFPLGTMIVFAVTQYAANAALQVADEVGRGIFDVLRIHGLAASSYWVGTLLFDSFVSLVLVVGFIAGTYARGLHQIQNDQFLTFAAVIFFIFVVNTLLWSYALCTLLPKKLKPSSYVAAVTGSVIAMMAIPRIISLVRTQMHHKVDNQWGGYEQSLTTPMWVLTLFPGSAVFELFVMEHGSKVWQEKAGHWIISICLGYNVIPILLLVYYSYYSGSIMLWFTIRREAKEKERKRKEEEEAIPAAHRSRARGELPVDEGSALLISTSSHPPPSNSDPSTAQRKGTEDEDVDEDVLAEAKWVAANPEGNQCLTADLRRVFWKDKVAVDGVSLGVRGGECFGLLGPNGAGKTTVVRMLLLELQSSGGATSYPYAEEPSIPAADDGDDLAASSSVVSKRGPSRDQRYRSARLGVCAQHDTLWDVLTAEEHLRIYLRIRLGPLYVAAEWKEYIEAALERVALGRKVRKQMTSGSYSGGMKRKLAVAIAIFTGARTVFLDEPSTGMDPHARRALWESIRQSLTADKAVLLTTHSMEEADAVCARIGIITDGKLKCIGNGQHLKRRFGKGYSIVLEMDASFHHHHHHHHSDASSHKKDSSARILSGGGGGGRSEHSLTASSFSSSSAFSLQPDQQDSSRSLSGDPMTTATTATNSGGVGVGRHKSAGGKRRFGAFASAELLVEELGRLFGPRLALVETQGSTVRCTVPTLPSLADAFEALEKRQSSWGVLNYSINQAATLEDIFLLFAGAAGDDDADNNNTATSDDDVGDCSQDDDELLLVPPAAAAVKK